MEGLEWIYRYYTGDCVDWWKYDYLYPPCLEIYPPFLVKRAHEKRHHNFFVTVGDWLNTQNS
jgi:hypothetical protein